jgi:hypothetical protein
VFKHGNRGFEPSGTGYAVHSDKRAAPVFKAGKNFMNNAGNVLIFREGAT